MNKYLSPVLAAAATLTFLAIAPSISQDVTDKFQPEPGTGVTSREPATATQYMVSAANPHAVEAGLDILRKGGNAADAVVAVQAMLGLVEPQSSGLGGGAFLLYFDAASGELTTIDGRETAPAEASGNLFLDDAGKPLDFFEAVVGGRSVGVPGVVRLLEKIHGEYGKLPWGSLFNAATGLAENGFQVSPRLAALIEDDRERLASQDGASTYFFDAESEPLKAGAILKNHDYAETLRTIAQAGPDEFYEGAIADRILDAVRLHSANPGKMTIEDLKSYEAKERPAVCIAYRGNDVCGMGPPSSGGLTVGQILGMVSHFDIAALGPGDPQSWRIVGDASRLAFADRGRYMADTDFVNVPKGLLNTGYLESRSRLIRRETALEKNAVSAGNPPWEKAEMRLDAFSFEVPSTSHFVIADAQGNVASMTSSIENVFGSRQFVAGFLLNNQLTDFSFLPEENGEAVANRVEPGKRPRSSMAPTIVLKDGKPLYALGSPGGSRIIGYVAATLLALIDWNLDMQAAVDLPHLVNRFGTYDLEAGTPAETLAEDLMALGYEIKVGDLNSGLHGIAFRDGFLEGGADSRREGVAKGD